MIKMNETKIELEKRTVWHGEYKGVGIEISIHGLERPNNWKPLNDGKGAWCAYIYIREKFTKRFNECWLEDILIRFTPENPEQITHNYTDSILDYVTWHCGISYYSKKCCTPNHRIIKAGCDYSHLYDKERNYNYTLEEILEETLKTADELITLLEITEK